MAFVYVLKNQRGQYYVGITALDPYIRLNRHNAGYVPSTKLGKPWNVVLSEKFANLRKAREREKQIKSWKGGNAFKKLVSKAAGPGFEPRYSPLHPANGGAGGAVGF